jgi:diaminopimelate decarboxylase
LICAYSQLRADCCFYVLLGGFGIPYFPGDMPVDIAAVDAALGQAFDALPSSLSGTHFCIEFGRYLVGWRT